MNRILKEIEYKGIFRFFEEICDIPHGSGNNKGISDYLVSFAKERNLQYMQDEYYNVIIIKEATRGYEGKPAVILQGHMDMVCEKNSDCRHDFLKDPLDLRIESGYIYAEGTTLGGDDGIAVAYALAILDDDSILHPRLEVVVTTDEETGMEGAARLSTSSLKARFLLNIDSEEEGTLLTSSAGGLTGTCRLPLEYETGNGMLVDMEVSGLQGGHSGTEINKNRTNGSLLMGRLLFELHQAFPFHLIDIRGGLKDNAIPRECRAVLLMEEKDATFFYEKFNECKAAYQNELKTSEPALHITCSIAEEVVRRRGITKESFDRILFLLLNAPNGVQVYSSDVHGFVESSLNLGILKIEEDAAECCYSIRSSFRTYKHFLSEKLRLISGFLGGNYYVRGGYEPWEYKKDSKLRDILIKVYIQDYGTPPKVCAIHAGLECGIFSGKMEGLDIVSLGPDVLDIHTPQEKLDICSAKRVYDYILHVLKEICETDE